MLTLTLMCVAIVIDIGNLNVHGRRLQTLVDAGALASVSKFVGCSLQVADKEAANDAIRTGALEYAGDFARHAGTENFQVQEPADVRIVLNSSRYWKDGDPVDGFGLDDTIDFDGNPATPGDPCSTSSLDVKGTDDNAPLLFGFIPLVIDPKRHARIQIEPVVEQNGMLPWAVPEIDPAAVAAIFVDEDSGDVLASPQLLEKQDLVSTPFADWSTPPGSEGVDLASPNMGVIILVSKTNASPTLTGSLTAICNQAPNLVKCYGGDGATDGIGFIHGWSGTPGNPRIGDVSLSNVDCPEELSAPYFYRSGGCDLGLTAVIDFGVANPASVGADVELDAPGCGGGGCNMAYQGPGPSGTEGIWATTQSATLGTGPNDDGRQDFSIHWDNDGGSGTFVGVAHPYVADDLSGPIEYLDLGTSDAAPDGNSREQSPPARSVIVTVGFRKPFQLESPLAPPVVLRVASPSGSQNQAFDCDEHINFQNEISNGCVTTYKENYGDFDDDDVNEWHDILCAGYPNGAGLPPEPTDPIPDCVRVETGDKIGPFRQGLRDRFETPCGPNSWPQSEAEYDNFRLNYDFTNDPRYVTLIITDYTAFGGSGSSEAVPVKYFAGFYVTGWDVEGGGPGCGDNDMHPWYPGSYKKSLDNGDVWGHFINVVIFSAAGKGNNEPCDFDEVGTCIGVLIE